MIMNEEYEKAIAERKQVCSVLQRAYADRDRYIQNVIDTTNIINNCRSDLNRINKIIFETNKEK